MTLKVKVSGIGADLIVMTDLLIKKVMTGNQFVDLANREEKTLKLSLGNEVTPKERLHTKVEPIIPSFALLSFFAIVAWFAYFSVSSLLLAFG